MVRFSRTLILIACTAATVSAQASRTWVSGVGDDVNPCSRTAPCKTWAGAISKTAPGGEISALDPGGFGGVTITKSMTLNGDGDLASILVTGTPGITVNAGPNDTIIIRGLSINGVGSGINSGTHGIRFVAGGTLIVENSSIYGFNQDSIDIPLSANGSVIVKNTSLEGGTMGVNIEATGGRANVSLDHVSIQGTTGEAIHGSYSNGFTVVTNSVITNNTGYGVLADAGEITVENSAITFNGVAVQSTTGATVRLSNNAVYGNQTGFGCGGGTLASAGNNRKGSNSGGVVPVCAPNATITVQ